MFGNRLSNSNFLYRVLVTKVDLVGGKLEGPDTEIRKDESPNPKGSIQGRMITGGADRATPEKELPVFWPLFPFDLMPVKEGEHVYVIFEDNNNRTHGLWVSRAPDNFKIEQLNLVPGEKKYKDNPDGDSSDVGIDAAAQDTDLDATQPKQSDDFVKEDVPPFTARVGDRAIHGSNNTLILMTRDRVDDPSTGQKEGSGTIFLIAGRKDKEKINLKDDQAFIIISSKTDVDKNLAIKGGDDKSGVSTVAIKSDEIRISARKGMKVYVEKGDVFIKADGKLNIETSKDISVKTDAKVDIKAAGVNVGGEDSPATRADKLQTLWTQLKTQLTVWSSSVIYSTAMGPTIGPGVPPLQVPAWDSSIASNNVKVKS